MNTTQLSYAKMLRAIPMAAAAAALLNGVLYLIGYQFGLLSDSVRVPGQNEPIGLVPVVMASIMPMLLAGGALALLNRFTRRPLAIFTTLCLVLLVLSFANPFVAIPNIPLSMGLWLNLMHVVVVLSLLYFAGQTQQAVVPALS
ncbi:hypothetical protein GCM10023185_46170 [Hymenobacter saemangeumensis]|uniref:Uncharacterized protein n=1 Tax=Hymenobacter saemangeumensis TaxID=1084522 RepID=A0ABP8IT96_9BACT